MADVAARPVESVPDPPNPSPGPTPDDSLSLSDHEKAFGPTRGDQVDRAHVESATPPAETPPPEPEIPESASAETEDRDEKGRFVGKKRHRAESAIASPADVPRIQQLTARLRAAEAERDALKAQTSVPRDTPPPAAQPPAPVTAALKPSPDQFTDYGEYVEALTDWKTDQKLAAADAKRQQAEQQRAAETEAKRIETSFNERKAAARLRYPDFDDVALNAPTNIPAGSLIDAWILEHKTGADVLYHLQQHPDELQTLLEQPVLEQAETLALLAQRFNGHGRAQAASSGSAAPSPTPTTPKPPNPLRTGPVRAGDEPPGESASLADHEKYWQPRRRRA